MLSRSLHVKPETLDSHVTRVFSLKPRKICVLATVLFSIFEVEVITKHLMSGAAGKKWDLFHLDANVSSGFASGKQNSLFPLEAVIKFLVLQGGLTLLPFILSSSQ